MFKKFYIIFTIITLIVTSAVFDMPGDVEAASQSSDRVSLSWPGAGANHTLKFKVSNDIPAGGSIVVTPDAGAFFIMSSFDVAEVDLATSSLISGPFVDRELASTSSATADGVSVVASTTNGSLTIDLNSSGGILADTFVQIELGTNATYNEIGTAQIMNPATTSSYSLHTNLYDAGGQLIEKVFSKIFIIEPVTMSSFVTFKRADGSPNGWLGNGTSETIMSLFSNYPARCRYSSASNTPFAAMTDQFSYIATSGQVYHTTIISGLQNGQEYDIYIRCEPSFGSLGANDATECHYPSASTTPWTDALGEPVTLLDCVDYWLHFGVSGVEGAQGDSSGTGDPNNPGEGEASSSGNAPGTGSGGSGSGGGDDGGRGDDEGRDRGDYLPYPPPPGAPGVALVGWAYPGRDVNVLQDNVQIGWTSANQDGGFGAFLEDLNQGVYTFSVWTDDINKNQSPTYSTTFWIDDGTQTTVTDIIIPPTLLLNNNNAEIGDTLEISGYSVPGKTLEIWIYPSSLIDPEANMVTALALTPDSLGRYVNYFSTSQLTNGEYNIRSRVTIDNVGTSQWSKSQSLVLGGELAPTGACAGADLNQDGQVNLTDFSILLYHWGTANECADQNDNGSVELIDFSIMMYYWTG